jgi:hypothetical protein
MAADSCKARGADEIEKRNRTRRCSGESGGELAVMKTFTVPAGDLPSADGLSGEGNGEAPAGGGPAGGRESGVGKNGDGKGIPERGWGFIRGFWSLVHGAPVEWNWTSRAVSRGGIIG